MIFKLKHEASGGKYLTMASGDGRLSVMTVLKWSELMSLTNSSDALDTYEGEKVQRRVNNARARKFADYLFDRIVKQERFIIPPLVMTIIAPVDFDRMAYPLLEFGSESFGKERLPAGTTVVINDGQHRVTGIRMLLDRINCMKRSEVKDLCLSLTDIKMNEIAAQVQCCFEASDMQQYFADINSNASKPTRSISLFFDKVNPFNESVSRLAKMSSVIRDRIDYDKNMPSGKSEKVFGFAGLISMVQSFYPGATGKEALTDDAIQVLIDVFERLKPYWEMPAVDLREHTMAGSLVFLKGMMAFAGDVVRADPSDFSCLDDIPIAKDDYLNRAVDGNGRVMAKRFNEILITNMLKQRHGIDLSPIEMEAERNHNAAMQSLEDIKKGQ